MANLNCPHCGEELSIAVTKPLQSRFKGTEPRPPVARDAPQLKLVTCNRCGQGDLCWQESKNGKFYLCKARIESDGKVTPLRKEFHVCQ